MVCFLDKTLVKEIWYCLLHSPWPIFSTLVLREAQFMWWKLLNDVLVTGSHRKEMAVWIQQNAWSARLLWLDYLGHVLTVQKAIGIHVKNWVNDCPELFWGHCLVLCFVNLLPNFCLEENLVHHCLVHTSFPNTQLSNIKTQIIITSTFKYFFIDEIFTEL